MPFIGVPGRCAVVPDGNLKAPVELATTFWSVPTVNEFEPLVCKVKIPVASALLIIAVGKLVEPACALIMDAID
jgi:hypothetical protein